METLEGEYAFCLWDRRERRALLGRDSLGVKPLLLARQNGGVWFASEVKALLAILPERPALSHEGVVEALRATGASYAQVLSFAVLPQILPDLISFTLYRLETNIRAASVLGLIGAGGIGYLMSTSFRTFQYQEAAAIVLALIVLVMIVDGVSSRLRKLVV